VHESGIVQVFGRRQRRYVGFETVQHRVDLADGGVAPVHLLGEVPRTVRLAMLAQIVGGVNQHAAGA